jgi:small ubiquitin-related modifier|tara:strand:- start:298 stop:561 length:264 start_codon:yes stop_codon:yes gene_type:complete
MSEGTLQLSVSCQGNGGATTVTKFKVKKGTAMGKVMKAFASQHNFDLTSLKFIFDGVRITKEDTPKTLELEDGDQVDCFLEQVGGEA